MSGIYVTGGKPLHGCVHIQGSKNAALPMMAAALLHKGVTTLVNCPRIRDVFCMADLMESLGAGISWSGSTLRMDCTNIQEGIVPEQYAVQMRSSITCMGSLLARLGHCEIPYPGGCMIGRRPVDIHLDLFRHWGAEILEEGSRILGKCESPCGFTYRFPKRSVGATENGIMAAVLSRGVTELDNCATEPEVAWLCRLLIAMGGEIYGVGSETLVVCGDAKLRDTVFRVPPDRIVAGTYLCASAISKGMVDMEPVIPQEMEAILSIYEKMGGQYEVKGGKLFTNSTQVHEPVPFLETEVYPGLPTDLQSQLLSVLSVIPGESVLRENVFENRFLAAQELQKMGADLTICESEVKIKGKEKLKGTTVQARELRGGAALVLAGLAAQGETLVLGAEYIERGYEDICRDLGTLGAETHKE